MKLLDERFRRSCELHSDRPALVAAGARWTYEELSARVDAFAAELQRRGLGPHDRVAIDLANGPWAVVAIHGVLRAGCVFSCMDAASPAPRFRSVVEDLDPALLVTRAGRLRADAEIVRVWEVIELESCEKILVRGRASAEVEGRDPDDMANIVYTSGSTGEQKGVVMTHASVLAAADAISGYLGMAPTDRVLCVLPLSFDYGLYQVLMTHLSGGCLVLEAGFGYPGPLLSKLRDEEITILPGVPTVFEILLRTGGFGGDVIPSLRCLTNTGAGVPLDSVRELRSRFPDAELFLMYGLTECKRVSYLPPGLVDRHPDSVGRPMEGCEARVVDQAGNELPPGETGELVVRGANLMQGYWRRPEQTVERLRPGPFGDEPCLWTGDLFRRDAEGLLYFVGRRDDQFKCRGEKVAPAEVEAVLAGIEGVAEAAILPVADAVRGTRIVAFLLRAACCTLSPAEVHTRCVAELEPRKVPHEYRFVREFPRSAHGKLDRGRLPELLAEAKPVPVPGESP